MNEQIEEFMSLLHQMLKLGENPKLKELYPNFSQLTVNEISVIDLVSRNPQIILKDICTKLNLPKSTLSNVINALDKKGYLYRTIVKQDFRSYGLKLTEKGLLAQEEHLQYEQDIIGGILSSLDTSEYNSLLHIMKKIILHSKNMVANPNDNEC